jgi:hypothetical protein
LNIEGCISGVFTRELQRGRDGRAARETATDIPRMTDLSKES